MQLCPPLLLSLFCVLYSKFKLKVGIKSTVSTVLHTVLDAKREKGSRRLIHSSRERKTRGSGQNGVPLLHLVCVERSILGMHWPISRAIALFCEWRLCVVCIHSTIYSPANTGGILIESPVWLGRFLKRLGRTQSDFVTSWPSKGKSPVTWLLL